jgi:2-keto-4-pentenoate hydratase
MDFRLHSPKSVTWLRQFHEMVFVAAQWAVQAGECQPEKVIEELQHVVRRLTGHWRGMTRKQVLQQQAHGPRAPWPRERKA